MLNFTEGEFVALGKTVLYIGEVVLEGVCDGYSHQPAPAEERALNSWLFGVHAALTRRQEMAERLHVKPAQADEQGLQAKLEAASARIGRMHYPYPAPSGTWLEGLELASRRPYEGAPTLSDAYAMARVNLQRAIERVILAQLLAEIHRAVDTSGPDKSGNAAAIQLLWGALNRRVTAARARIDRLGLLLGGDAAQECAQMGYAEMMKFSVMEQLELDNRLPGGYPVSAEDSLRASIQAAGERLAVVAA